MHNICKIALLIYEILCILHNLMVKFKEDKNGAK